MKKYVSILVIGLMLSLCFSVNAVSSTVLMPTSDGTTFYVDDDFNESTPGYNITNFDKIQSAIDGASDNDTVFVFNGTYYENVTIHKSIHLIGENNEQTIIKSPPNKGTIMVRAEYVEISNFTIIAEGTIVNSISLGINGHARIVNNIIESDINGIDIFSSSYNEILENYFKSSLVVHSSSDNTISNNIFDHGCLYIDGSNNNQISHNLITFTNYGIMTNNICLNNIISYNIIKDCNFGIRIGGRDKNTISYNDFLSNKYLNTDISSKDCTWYHNYWGGTELKPIPWRIPLPKPIVCIAPFGIVFDRHPAIRRNCDFGDDI